MAGEHLLELTGVVREFGANAKVRTRVLDGVDLRVDRGELVALIGPSGSGKSTLLNLVGLLDRPTAGRIVLAGQDTGALDDDGLTRLRARTLGFVFQFHHLLPAFTTLENVILPSWGDSGWPSDAVRERAREMLAAVGLGAREGARVTELSGGQQQRVALARALVHRPALVLADEPTGNLDTRSSDEVFELLRRLNADEGTAFVVVTHDPRIAARCARVVEIADGRIVRDERRIPPGAP